MNLKVPQSLLVSADEVIGLGVPTLEQDDFSSNRHPALSFRLSMKHEAA